MSPTALKPRTLSALERKEKSFRGRWEKEAPARSPANPVLLGPGRPLSLVSW